MQFINRIDIFYQKFFDTFIIYRNLTGKNVEQIC